MFDGVDERASNYSCHIHLLNSCEQMDDSNFWFFNCAFIYGLDEYMYQYTEASFVSTPGCYFFTNKTLAEPAVMHQVYK